MNTTKLKEINIKRYVIFSIVLSLLIQVVTLTPAILMQRIIDLYIPNKETTKLLGNIILFISIPFAFSILSAFYKYKITLFARNKGNELSLKGIERLMYQKLGYFNEHNSSELISYCSKESMNYVLFWSSDLPKVITKLFVAVGVLFYIGFININVALIQLLYVPILIIPSNYLSKISKKEIKNVVSTNAEITQLKHDLFRGIDEINQANNRIVKIWGKVAFLDNLNGIWNYDFVKMLLTGITFAVSAYFIMDGLISIGELIVIISYIRIYYMNISELSQLNLNWNKQMAEFEKLFEFLGMDDERDYDLDKKPFVFNNKIVYDQVRFSYTHNSSSVLKGVSLEINKGDWVGIVGESGSGKTTLFDVLLKLYDEGDGIFIDGVPLGDIESSSIRTEVTKVSQNIFVFPGSIRDNLLLVNNKATERELYYALEIAQLKDYVERLPNGIDTPVGENGTKMSGGERQRLSFAQGILKNSKVLLLDEVTANLDESTENKIKKSIKKLQDERNLTIVSISHNQNFNEYANVIYKVEDGIAYNYEK